MTDKNEQYDKVSCIKSGILQLTLWPRQCWKNSRKGKLQLARPLRMAFIMILSYPALTPEDLDSIEKRMRGIIQSKVKFERKVVSAEEARKIFHDQPFKLELIAGLEEGKLDEDGNPIAEKPEISIYVHDGFTDLCRGPHVEISTQIIPPPSN